MVWVNVDTIELVPGELVQLKSGGPIMTVQARSQEGLYVCRWFPASAAGCSQTETFRPEVLLVQVTASAQ